MGGKHAGKPKKDEPLTETGKPGKSTDDTLAPVRGKHAKDGGQGGQKK